MMQFSNGADAVVFSISLVRPQATNDQKSSALTLSYFYEAQLRLSLSRCLIRWGAITPTQRVLRNLTKDLLTKCQFLSTPEKKRDGPYPCPAYLLFEGARKTILNPTKNCFGFFITGLVGYKKLRSSCWRFCTMS